MAVSAGVARADTLFATRIAGDLVPISLPGNVASAPENITGLPAGSYNIYSPTAASDGRTLYMITGSPLSVWTLNATGAVGRSIGASGAQTLAITPDGSTLLAFSAAGSLVPISTATNTPATAITIPSDPLNPGGVPGIAVTADSGTAYVLNGEQISTVNLRTRAVTGEKVISAIGQMNHMVVSPNGSTLWVTSTAGSLYSIATATMTASAPLGSGNVSQPDALAITPDGSAVYVGSSASYVPVLKITTSTGALAQRLPATTNGAVALAMSSDGNTLYVGNGPNVFPVNIGVSPATVGAGIIPGNSWAITALTITTHPPVQPPTATISAPAAGQTYTLGQTVTSAFSCAEGSGAPGIASCADSHGGSGSHGTLDTSSAGSHTYTVTATSSDGQTATAAVSYTVAGPPTATINSPLGGGTYAQNQVVTTAFRCLSGVSGAAIATCVDSGGGSGTSGTLNTAAIGSHTYTVTATAQDGQSATASLAFTVAAPPAVTISSPEPDQAYVVGQTVASSFACTEGASGPGIASCADSHGGTGTAGTLDTLTAGVKTYTVTATSQDGQSAAASIGYTVAPDAPNASIASPAAGRTFAQNQVVPTRFACLEGAGGTGLATCLDDAGTAAPAGSLDTSTLGSHTYTVTAISQDGKSNTASVGYTVAAPPTAEIVTPAGGGRYAVGQSVPTTFSCAEGTDGPGVATCADSHGGSGTSGTLDTSTPGDHSYTVTATSADGQMARNTIGYTVAAAPEAAIGSPAPGSTYAVGQSVTTSFSCQDGTGGPGIASCADSHGGSGTSGTLETSSPGPHTYTVTATSQDGQSSAAVINYKVAAPPAASIALPADGQTLNQGQSVATSFSCAEGSGGPGISTCTDSAGSPGPSAKLDTSTPGSHTYTVTATSTDGQVATAAIGYTVVGPPSAGISSPLGGGTYAQNQLVPTSFWCLEAVSGPGLAICADGAGGTADGGGVLDTSSIGSHTYTVTAASQDGQTGSAGLAYSVAAPPSAIIAAPVTGATYAVDQPVLTSFSCAEGSHGPGVNSCVDSGGATPPGGQLDTTATGPRTYTVTATSADGQTATATIHYTVAAAPSASISAPSEGGTYQQGSFVPTSFSCAEGTSGPGIATCLDSGAAAPPAAQLDTATPGLHTYAVTATSQDGQSATTTIHYTVLGRLSAHISAPADGGSYAVGQAVPSSFSCTEGYGGPGIDTCTDSQGGAGTAGTLDTSSIGAHTYTVTARSLNGTTAATQISYTVAAAPAVSIGAPAGGGTYAVRQTVATGFSCTEGASGLGLASCTDSHGSSGSSGTLDTAAPGPHTYTVTALSQDGQHTAASIDYTVAGAPSASIASPTAGGTYAVGQTVASSFSCAEGPSGPGLASCVDSGGAAGGTGALDTSSAGSHTYTLTATSQDGQTTTKSIAYTVAAPPAATITSPAEGRTFNLGQVVRTSFSCGEGASGPGIASCADSGGGSGTGGTLPTLAAGPQTYTLTATSRDGQTASASIHYTVAAPPTAAVTAPAPGGTYAVGQLVSTTFQCFEGVSGPGITACADSSGAGGGSGALNTASAGSQTYTVTATGADGQTGTTSLGYTVAGAPTVRITTPAPGQTYAVGQAVATGFACAEGASGPGLLSCADSHGGAGPTVGTLDTAAPGSHSYSVTATSKDGQTASAAVSYAVAAAPNANITTPADAQTFVQGSVVATAFSCSDGDGGPGISTCSDGAIGSGGAGQLSTSVLGHHTYTVTATSHDGQSATTHISYTVAAPPTASITPLGGAIFTLGQSVPTTFSCAESANGPGIASCADSGGATGTTGILDTSTGGPHTYTVTATSKDGATATASVPYTVIAAPAASISSPADGQTFAYGQAVATGFSCAEGSGGPGLLNCVDSGGSAPPSGRLITTTPGPNTYTVYASSKDGKTSTATIHYTVAQAPSASITAPQNGATVALGQLVSTKFACAEGAGGPGVASCVDSNRGSGSGGTLDTSSTGPHTYTVTATSGDGQTSVASISYTVAGHPAAIVASPANGGTYGAGTSVPTSYSCTDGASGPGIVSCADSNGRSSGAGGLDTTAAGPHTYTVTAVSGDGQSTTASISYLVASAQAPRATITSPADGATVNQGQTVTTAFACAEGLYGPGISTCTDSLYGPAPYGTLATNTFGAHTYTVTASSKDGKTGTATIHYTVAAPPSATINSPALGYPFAQNQTVATGFSCTEGASGPGIATCRDSNGGSGTAGTLDTSTLGLHTYTVTATSNDGQTSPATLTYTVAGAPTASISSPASGQRFSKGQVVKPTFTCADGTGGPGIRSCFGATNPASLGTSLSSTLDTSTTGAHTYTVIATSSDGQTGTTTLSYTVVGPPSAGISVPASQQYFLQGSSAPTRFACTDDAAGPGISSCADSSGGSGTTGTLNTSALGPHTYTVTATSSDGQTASARVTYNVAGAPSASITSPTDGASVPVGKSVGVFFSCTDGALAPGIATCAGPSGAGSGTSLDTATVGPHTYTITATSLDGATATASIKYTVIGAPATTITSPADGASYKLHQSVATTFSCTEYSGGPGVTRCADSSGVVGVLGGNGTLDTSTSGKHTYTVTALSSDGLQNTGTITYYVAVQVPPTASVSSPADGQTYSVGQSATATFACADPSGPGLSGCRDSTGASGASGGTGTLPTTFAGSFTYTVTAASLDGQTGKATIHYNVAAPPQVVLTSPSNGQLYARGDSVVTYFSCVEGIAGLGIASCTDSNGGSASSGTLDTSTAGAHSYTITATSKDGQTATKTISYMVAADPSATISSPVAGGLYGVGESVPTSFSCADGAHGPGIYWCTDSNAGDAPGGRLNTSVAGPHTYTVTAMSRDGLTSTATIHYTVAAAPAVTISSPAAGRTYFIGQWVTSAFACTEGTSGPGISSCIDSGGASANAGQLDTSQAGVHTYTVTATSRDGQTGTTQISYTVTGYPSAKINVPADGSTFALGQTVLSTFNCFPATGDGLAGITGLTCVDSAGGGSGAERLDTSTPGPHAFSVTATSATGASAATTIHYTVAGPPTATIASPADGQSYEVGQTVPASFSCEDGASGPGISSCTDSGGASGGSGTLNTSKPGAQTYTVTATSRDGQTSTTQIVYDVAKPPAAFIEAPVDGQVFSQGQAVATRFACVEGVGGPGVASCVDANGGSDGNGTLDTSALGPHTYTVIASSLDGQLQPTTIGYTVVAPPTATIGSPGAGGYFAVGQNVVTSFSCADDPNGPGIASCLDTWLASGGTGHLDTGGVGPASYSVTAQSQDGQSSTSRIGFTVAGAPSAAITAPAHGLLPATYAVGQIVATSFVCADGASAPGIAACTDSGGASTGTGSLDTSTAGHHTYTVHATSGDGQSGSASLDYIVADPPSAWVTSPDAGGIYSVGQVVPVTWDCGEGADGPWVASCFDTAGHDGRLVSGVSLDTSTLGPHTFPVTATSLDGQSAQTVLHYTVAAPPAATISSPVDGAKFVLRQNVPTAFACTDSADGPGLASCSDSNGGSGTSGTLDTSTPGWHTYTVTATSSDGQTGTRDISYEVAGAPSARVISPANGSFFTQGQTVSTAFTCGDDSAGPGIASCVDGSGDAAPTGQLDTSQLGAHTYSVTTASSDGETGQTSVNYTVAAPPSITINTPAEGQRFSPAEAQGTKPSFSCTDGVDGTGIASCASPDPLVAYRGLDASFGSHELTIKAVSQDGLTSTVTRHYTVGLAPEVTLWSPADGQSYRVGESVPTSFTCVEGPGGPGLSSCVDTNGGSGTGGTLDTATPGSHTYTVTALSADGLSDARTISYQVGAPPTAAISSPADGQTFITGQKVVPTYACTPGMASPAVSSCFGPASLDTSSPGHHTYTVTAQAPDGQTGSASIGYTVVVPGPPSIQVSGAADGQTFAVGQVVRPQFVCDDGDHGPGLATCEDSDGVGSLGTFHAGQAMTGLLRTLSTGPHTYTVTTSSTDGQTASVTINYTVAHVPTATIASPRAAGMYLQGQRVPTTFTCVDDAQGPGIASCTDSSGASSPGGLDTSATGTHTYTVTATSADGASSKSSIVYSVLPQPAPMLLSIFHTSDPSGTLPKSGLVDQGDPAAKLSVACGRAPLFADGIDRNALDVASCEGGGAVLTSSCGSYAIALGYTACGDVPVDTATLGRHTITAKATTAGGATSTYSASYFVTAAPTVNLLPPAWNGARCGEQREPCAIGGMNPPHYEQGDEVPTSFACVNSSTPDAKLLSCKDSNGASAPAGHLDTSHVSPLNLLGEDSSPWKYTVTASDSNHRSASASYEYYVDPRPPLGARISIDQDPLYRLHSYSLHAVGSGGYPPYRFDWDYKGDLGAGPWQGSSTGASGCSDPGCASFSSGHFSFDKTGFYTLHVRVTDAKGHIAVEALDVPVGLDCAKKVDLEGTLITGQCLSRVSADSGDFVSYGPFQVNGTNVAGEWHCPSSRCTSVKELEETPVYLTAGPDGVHIDSDAAYVYLGNPDNALNALSAPPGLLFHGPLHWRVGDGTGALSPAVGTSPTPGGNTSQAAVGDYLIPIAGLTPPVPIKVHSLPLESVSSMYAGHDQRGYYTLLNGNFGIADLHTGISPTSPKTTLPLSVRIEPDGSYGLVNSYAYVDKAYWGPLTVKELCLSYQSAKTTFGQAAAKNCSSFTDTSGQPFLTCPPHAGERWDASAGLGLPFGSSKIALSGGLQDGNLSWLATSVGVGVSNIPLLPPLAYFDNLRAGFCAGPPLTLKAGATIGVGPLNLNTLFGVTTTIIGTLGTQYVVTLDGNIGFTDSYNGTPWRFDVGTQADPVAMRIYGQKVASGYFDIQGNGVLSGGAHFYYDPALGLFTVDGGVDGWLSMTNGDFDLEGDIHACAFWHSMCLNANGLVSTIGISVCTDVTPEINFGALGSVPPFRVGFGYGWDKTYRLMAGSCDVSPWRKQQPAADVQRALRHSRMRVHAAADGSSAPPSVPFTVPAGSKIFMLRVHGDGKSSPDLEVQGPGGAIVKQVDHPQITQDLVVQDRSTHTTIISLIQPAAGTWTIVPLNGSVLGSIDGAHELPRPMVTGGLTSAGGGLETLHYSFKPQSGVKVYFREAAADKRAAGELGKAPASCADPCTGAITFKPSLGNPGKRYVEAVILRNGFEIDQQRIASYLAPKVLLGRAPHVRAFRTARGTKVCWTPVAGAADYEVAATETLNRPGRAWRLGWSEAGNAVHDCAAFPDAKGAGLIVRLTALDGMHRPGRPLATWLYLRPRPRPARPAGVAMQRSGGRTVLLTLSPARGSASELIVVRLAGRVINTSLASACNTLAIHDVLARTRVSVIVTGARADGVTGAPLALTLAGGRQSARIGDPPTGACPTARVSGATARQSAR